MTSRNSFLANLKEDNKRRLWLWLVAAFVFIIFSSLLFLVVMASIDENGIIMQYGKRAEEILSISVSERCGFLLGMNFYREKKQQIFGIMDKRHHHIYLYLYHRCFVVLRNAWSHGVRKILFML